MLGTYYKNILIGAFHQVLLTCKTNNIFILIQTTKLTRVLFILSPKHCYFSLKFLYLRYTFLPIQYAIVVYKSNNKDYDAEGHNILRVPAFFNLSYYAPQYSHVHPLILMAKI